MKNILVVAEVFGFGGLETHIQGEIRQLTRLGWQVHLACGDNFKPDLLPSCTASVTSGLPFSPSASLEDLRECVGRLESLIRENKIIVLHAHPFLSLFPAMIAAERCGVPCAVSLHGPVCLDMFHTHCHAFLLNSVVLPGADLVIAVSEEVRALSAPFAKPGRVVVENNAIALDDFLPKRSDSPRDPRWLAVSRLDSFKTVGLAKFVRLARTAGLPGIAIAGDGPSLDDLKKELAREGLLDQVEFLGGRSDVPSLMSKFSGVAGMGRVVLEGISVGRPVCLIGYNGVKGLIDKTLFVSASEFNFSGRNLPDVTEEEFIRQIATLQHTPGPEIDERLVAFHNEGTVWTDFERQLESLKAGGHSLATDIYAWVRSNADKEEGPYLSSPLMYQAIGRLSYSLRYMNHPALQSHFHYLSYGQIAWLTHSATERDAEIVRLKSELTEREGQIVALEMATTEREGQIVALEMAMTEREGQIVALEMATTERDRNLNELEKSTSYRLGRFIMLVIGLPMRTIRKLRNIGIGLT